MASSASQDSKQITKETLLYESRKGPYSAKLRIERHRAADGWRYLAEAKASLLGLKSWSYSVSLREDSDGRWQQEESSGKTLKRWTWTDRLGKIELRGELPIDLCEARDLPPGTELVGVAKLIFAIRAHLATAQPAGQELVFPLAERLQVLSLTASDSRMSENRLSGRICHWTDTVQSPNFAKSDRFHLEWDPKSGQISEIGFRLKILGDITVQLFSCEQR